MVATFAHEYGLAVVVLALLAMVGGFAVAPFSRPFGVLAAPLAGIGVLALGCGGLYSIAGLSFNLAAASTVVCASLLTLLARPRVSLFACLMVLALAAVAVLIHCGATLAAGSPAAWLGAGTDHANYAHAADWMRSYSIGHLREPSSGRYEDVPRWLLTGDTRLGAFSFVAFVSSIAQRPSLFAYDLSTAVCWGAAVLGIAGAIAERRSSLLLLVVGLACASLYDLVRAGFLAKVLAYPFVPMLAGLFMLALITPLRTFLLSALAAGAATLLYGPVLAFLLGVMCVLFVFGVALAQGREQAFDRALVLCSVIGSAALATGNFSQVWILHYPGWSLPWPELFPVVLDVQSQWRSVSGWGRAADVWFGVAAVAAWLGLLAIAIRHAVWPAVSFLLGPMLLLAALMIAGAVGVMLQMVAIFYIAVLCGGVILFDWGMAKSARRTVAIVAALVAVTILIRAPRLVALTEHLGWRPTAEYLYSLELADRLQAEIGKSAVTVETADTYFARFARAEMMRRVGLLWRAGSERLAGTSAPLPKGATDLVLSHPRDAVGGVLVWGAPSVALTRRGHGRP